MTNNEFAIILMIFYKALMMRLILMIFCKALMMILILMIFSKALMMRLILMIISKPLMMRLILMICSKALIMRVMIKMRYVYCHYETKSSYKNIYFQDECPICFAAKPQIYLLCGHIFHDECISKWLERSPTCPYCRTPFQ